LSFRSNSGGTRINNHSELGRLAVSVPSAARSLGLGRNAAYDAAKRGELPTVKIGRRILVPIDALHRMLAEGGLRMDGARK
jgi:excisionase family DNA binding protein